VEQSKAAAQQVLDVETQRVNAQSQAAAAGSPSSQPQTPPSSPTPPPPTPGRSQLVIGSNGNAFTIEWVDRDQDGKIDSSEKESAEIVRGNRRYRLGEKFFLLIDRGMDAESTLGDNVITKEELEEASAVVARYANELGMSFEDALQAYNSSSSFRKVSLTELREARTEIAGWLAGVTLYTEGALNEQAVREALKGKGANRSAY